MKLLDEATLENTGVVANCRMNRERRLSSYGEELGFSIPRFLSARRDPAWLDLCCGHGRALTEAAQALKGRFYGVDLVDTFTRPHSRGGVFPRRLCDSGNRRPNST